MLNRLILVLLALFSMGFRQGVPPPLPVCDAERLTFAELPIYEPARIDGFVRVRGAQFEVAGQPFRVYGVNYVPLQSADWLTRPELTSDSLHAELSLLHETGFNTVRVSLPYTALFDCPGSGAIPQSLAFQRLDMLVHTAAALDMRLILILNDPPDLTDYPLYDDPHFIRLQTLMLVSRYQHEAAIMAWDLRRGGDLDYDFLDGGFPQEQVLGWLTAAAAWVRGIDAQHLVTATWAYDLLGPEPYVDFVSLQHWENASTLAAQLADVQAETDRPVLLAEVGYDVVSLGEQQQAEQLAAALEVAEMAQLAGWVVSTAWDAPGTPAQQGLWRADYSVRAAGLRVRQVLQALIPRP